MAYVWAASIPLVMVAALLFATGAALQQSIARSAARTASRPNGWLPALSLMGTLLRNRWWLIGWAGNIVGFLLHATALHLGSIAVVQALLTVQLLFALPLAVVRRRGVKLRRTDWLGTGLVCSGLVVLVAQGIPHGELRRDLVPWAIAVAVLAMVTLVSVARVLRHHAQTRSALVAVAAGICFSVTAMLLVLTTDDLPHVSWPLPCVALSTLVGGLLAQDAFASGSLPTALTAMTITDPTVSYVAGAVLVDVAYTPHVLPLGFSGALVIGGVILLANSPTLHDERETPEPVRTLADVVPSEP